MRALDLDPVLRRFERTALGFCALAAVACVVLRRGNPDIAFGVLGGGVLVAVSYRAIKSGIDAILDVVTGGAGPGAEGDPPAAAAGAVCAASGPDLPPTSAGLAPGTRARVRVGAFVRFIGRYVALGLLAYVMVAVLRLHPVGLIIGVSSIVVSAAVEAARSMTSGSRSRG